MDGDVNLDVLLEDVEDLKAQLAQARTELETLRHQPAPDTGPGDAGDDVQDGAPPFIYTLDNPDAELAALIEWVEVVLVPIYLSAPSTGARWCARWYEHPDAIGWLHALWLAWQWHMDPVSGGWMGPLIWHRDCLKPALAELRSAVGPFEGCVKSPHDSQQHRLPLSVPSSWYSDEGAN